MDNLIEAFCRFKDTEDDFKGPVNMGNPKEFTINELAKLVIDMTGSRSDLIYKPLPSDDPIYRQPDISLARGKLGWAPKVDLEEGLKNTISYFENLLKKSKNK